MKKFICIRELLIECSADDVTNQTRFGYVFTACCIVCVLMQETADGQHLIVVFYVALPLIGHASSYLLDCFSNENHDCILIKLCKSDLNGCCIY